MRFIRRQTRIDIPSGSPAAGCRDQHAIVLGSLALMGDQLLQSDKVTPIMAIATMEQRDQAAGIGGDAQCLSVSVKMRVFPFMAPLYSAVLISANRSGGGIRRYYARACIERVIDCHGLEALHNLPDPAAGAQPSAAQPDTGAGASKKGPDLSGIFDSPLP